LKKNQLTPLPNKGKEYNDDTRVARASTQHRLQAARVVPSSQGLVSDFMSLVHLEMTKLASSIGFEAECLDESKSKHLSRLIASLDRLVKIESDVRSQSEVDRLDDKQLESKVKHALKALKIDDKEIKNLIEKSREQDE